MLIVFEHVSSKLLEKICLSYLFCLPSDRRTFSFEYYGGTWLDKLKTGTAHLSVIGPDGDAVALTSTVNL